MNLYMWSSTISDQYKKGAIVVMAESIEAAREQVLQLWMPLGDDGMADNYLIMLNITDDEDFTYEYNRKRNILVSDLSVHPTVIHSGVVFIKRG